LERAVGGEERYHGIYRSATESIVAEVDFNEGSFIFESIADRREGLWDFTDQTTSKDISKIGNLELQNQKEIGNDDRLLVRMASRTFRIVVFSRKSATA